jgi:Type IV secretion system pilin
MQKIKTIIAAAFVLALSIAPVALVSGAAVAASDAKIQNSTCAGANLDATQISGTSSCTTTNANAATDVNKIVGLVINIFSWVVGVVAVIAIIIGGFKYITSGGDAGGVTGAKNTILYAIVGLIIVALAQLIVKFVLGNVTQAV